LKGKNVKHIVPMYVTRRLEISKFREGKAFTAADD